MLNNFAKVKGRIFVYPHELGVGRPGIKALVAIKAQDNV